MIKISINNLIIFQAIATIISITGIIIWVVISRKFYFKRVNISHELFKTEIYMTMMKFLSIKNYSSMGEIVPKSNIYEFIRIENNIVISIMIDAGNSKIWKGYIFETKGKYIEEPLNAYEIKNIMDLTGILKICCFDDFIDGSILYDYYKLFILADRKEII